MGCVFRRSRLEPMPEGAEVVEKKGERLARWRDGSGKPRAAPIAPDGRVKIEYGHYLAEFRDGAGRLVRKPTRCREKSAALTVLSRFEREAERVRCGLITSAEAETVERSKAPIEESINAYLRSMEAAGLAPLHIHNTGAYLARLARDCGFKRLADLRRESLESWLAGQTKAGRSARGRNTHRAALIAFCNWCSDPTIGRLAGNPFRGVPKANEQADPRRPRRAATEAEIHRLLDIARRRPIEDAMTVCRGPNKGMPLAKVSPERREQLETLGRERALIYKTLILTGLRKSELASLTVGQVQLDGPRGGWIELRAADEKARRGACLPLSDDLAADLRQWLADRLKTIQGQASLKIGVPVPLSLPADAKLFRVPTALDKIMARDIEAAGIPARDERGKRLTPHSLRMTLATLMSRAGVPLRTAQEAMRHSDPKLTANIYTDVRLSDVQVAVNALPALPIDNGTSRPAKATGTDDH